ncbi:MAG: isoprenylcysteine carboxylmethyltransferase family protein [Promethearchaeota archaeon]
MEEELMFRIIFVVTYVIFGSVRIFYRSQAIGKEREREESLRDAPTTFLSIVIIVYFAAMFIYILVPTWIFWAHVDLHILLRWFGVILGGANIVFLVWIHHTLGGQYDAKLSIRKEHELIEAGPYKRIRHPMYTVFILFSLAVALISANLLLISFAFLIGIPFHWITQKEERMLTEQFGEKYQEYMKRTGKFLPPIRRKD